MINFSGWTSMAFVGCLTTGFLFVQEGIRPANTLPGNNQISQNPQTNQSGLGVPLSLRDPVFIPNGTQFETQNPVANFEQVQQSPGFSQFGEVAPVSNQQAHVGGVSVDIRETEMIEAITEYQKAESDEDRTSAKEKLAAALAADYEEIMQQHEKQLKQMEDRLARLRAQFDKRMAVKDAMVTMRLDSIVSELDGLGWPTPPNQSRVGPLQTSEAQSFPFNSQFALPTRPGLPANPNQNPGQPIFQQNNNSTPRPFENNSPNRPDGFGLGPSSNNSAFQEPNSLPPVSGDNFN